MDIILLPGNSIKNKEWIEEVEQAIKPDFNATRIQYYEHWKDGRGWKESGRMIDFDLELEKCIGTVESLGEYAIFAKSAGVLFALKGIAEQKISPVRCVFAGTAVHFALRLNLDIKKWLKVCTVPVLFVQKELDPAMSFNDLGEFLRTAGVQDYKMHEIPGHDHHYGDIKGLKDLIIEFIKVQRSVSL